VFWPPNRGLALLNKPEDWEPAGALNRLYPPKSAGPVWIVPDWPPKRLLPEKTEEAPPAVVDGWNLKVDAPPNIEPDAALGPPKRELPPAPAVATFEKLNKLVDC
jgi:hypothetical protein